MKLVDLTLPTPEENLALDEALLDSCEEGGEEILRFWEPQQYFVVVGYANKVDLEVNRPACEQANVPILRRCSGGGTVLQGPGCLNYSVVLKINDTPGVQTIPQTNDFVMGRQRRAVEAAMAGMAGQKTEYWSDGVMGTKVEQSNAPSLHHSVLPTPSIRGHTDLALGDLKISGNAQRRKRNALIFHGVFLLEFDLGQIARLLRPPSKEPDYRKGRSHSDFVTNLHLPVARLKAALQEIWSATTPLPQIPDIRRLVCERYARADWNLKF